MIIGGLVQGGQIFGQYPSRLSSDNPRRLSRGRMIPTMPWEGPWSGIATWLGVKDSQMPDVLPNLKNFPEGVLLREQQLFASSPPYPPWD